MLFEILLAAGIVLIIVALIVRDQTLYRLSRLRTELLALKSEEKRLSERREEIELMVAQIGEAVMRADRRNTAIEKGCTSLSNRLEALSELVGIEQPEGDQEGPQSA